MATIHMRLRFFLTMCALGGLGGFLGSAVGAAFSQRALFIGGFLGGVLIAPLAARIAVWRRWIPPARWARVTLGAALGFLAAATVAANTLSSPIGPILATSLTGIGALIARGRA